MATIQLEAIGFESGILTRLVRPEEANLTSAAAEAVLRLSFDPVDLARIHELTVKNQDDALTLDERQELESYLRVSALVDLMHAKARRSLKNKI